MAHTKKYILALLLACGVASSQCHGNPAVAAVVISGIGLGVNLAVQTGSALFGIEAATVSATVHDYELVRIMEYPSPQRREHRWKMCQDYKGNCGYTFCEIINGALVPGSVSTSQFSLGGPNALPLTKRELYCKTINQNYTTIISEKSSMTLAVSHTVTKPGGYWYTPPASVTVNFNLNVNRLPGTCYEQNLTGLVRTISCSVMHNGFILVDYPLVNYEVVGGNMTVD